MPEAVAPLDKCPFCQKDCWVIRHYAAPVGFSIQCSGCFICSALFDTKPEAIAAWNKRAEKESSARERELERRLELLKIAFDNELVAEVNRHGGIPHLPTETMALREVICELLELSAPIEGGE